MFKSATSPPASGANPQNNPPATSTSPVVTQTVTVNDRPPSTTPAANAPTGADRAAIISQLHAYVSAWQNISPSSLVPLLTPNVVRIGSVNGVCGTTVGRSAVIGLYSNAEMSSSTTDYTLLNMNPAAVRFTSATTAFLPDSYVFGASQPRFINFTFAKQRGTWLISKLHAWCRP